MLTEKSYDIIKFMGIYFKNKFFQLNINNNYNQFHKF